MTTFLTETTSKRPRTAKVKTIEEPPQLSDTPQVPLNFFFLKQTKLC